MSARLASQSTILPLPSSPHCAPMTVTLPNSNPRCERPRRSYGPDAEASSCEATVGTGRSRSRSVHEGSRMKPMTEQHLALFRRHMVEIIDMHFHLAAEEVGTE